jgi:hypothetical protein
MRDGRCGTGDDIVINQLGAVLAKPNSVFRTAPLLWREPSIESGTAGGGTCNMGGHPEINGFGRVFLRTSGIGLAIRI